MPLEIKELHIKATLSDRSDEDEDNAFVQNSKRNKILKETNAMKIEVAVEKVLEILKNKNER